MSQMNPAILLVQGISVWREQTAIWFKIIQTEAGKLIMMKTRSEENSTHHLRIVYEILNIDESSCIEIQYVPESSTWNWKIPGYELITGSVERNTEVRDQLLFCRQGRTCTWALESRRNWAADCVQSNRWPREMDRSWKTGYKIILLRKLLI